MTDTDNNKDKAVTNEVYGDNEAEARFRRLLKSAVNTPPAPLKSLAPIGVPAQQKKRGRKPSASSEPSSSREACGRSDSDKQD